MVFERFKVIKKNRNHIFTRALSLKIRAARANQSSVGVSSGSVDSAEAASQRERRRIPTGWANGWLPALPDPPSRAASISSFLHDTHDLFYYFYFSLIILLNGLFRCSMKLLKSPFRMLLAFTTTSLVSFRQVDVQCRPMFGLRCQWGLLFQVVNRFYWYLL